MLAVRLMKHGTARLERSVRESIFRHTGFDATIPAFVQCMLTEACNYRCQYCSHWRQDNYSPEMSASEWKRVLLSLKGLTNTLLIDFAGGEPTLYPHFLELVEFCHAQGIDWVTTTNGSTLTKTRFVQKLVAASPLKIDVSVDSASASVHDTARGVSGSLTRVEQGIKNLIAERNRLGQNFAVRLKVTVHRLNARDLVGMVLWAEAVGATSVDFNPVRGLWRKDDIESLSIRSSSDLAALQDQIEQLVRLKSSGGPIETSEDDLRAIVSCFAGTLTFAKVKCRDPLRNFLISPSGDVRSCGCSPPLGNVKQQSAVLVWRGQAARKARRKSLACSLEVAMNKGATTCTSRRTLRDDIQRALLLLGLKSSRKVRD